MVAIAALWPVKTPGKAPKVVEKETEKSVSASSPVHVHNYYRGEKDKPEKAAKAEEKPAEVKEEKPAEVKEEKPPPAAKKEGK